MSQLNLCMDIELVLLHILFGMFEVVIFPVDLTQWAKTPFKQEFNADPFKYDLRKKTT
ncbi:hypothetical protein [Lysinibacillus sp. OL1]|uniref:hypothetical protein n=1 Tax=Lysinibacillus sp. OL1 TaxID=2517243 RepID=UPI00187D1EE6|nr:hypothetical protein [Lysinibacillus sp. OL1]